MYTFLAFLFLAPTICVVSLIIFFDLLKVFRKPKLNRAWDNLYKVLPQVIYNEKTGEIFIKNLRNAKYNPVFEFENKIEYLSKRYNLKDLNKIWILTNGGNFLNKNIVISFQFGEVLERASFLALSYEVRKTDVLSFTATNLFYKFFEGCFILGTEEDLFYVRTNVRKEEGEYFLYESETEKEALQKIFLKFAGEINLQSQVAREYKFYKHNSLTETLGILRKERILKFRNWEYFFTNIILTKNSHNQKFKIKNTHSLKADEHYSLRLRSQLERVG